MVRKRSGKRSCGRTRGVEHESGVTKEVRKAVVKTANQIEKMRAHMQDKIQPARNFFGYSAGEIARNLRETGRAVKKSAAKMSKEAASVAHDALRGFKEGLAQAREKRKGRHSGS